MGRSVFSKLVSRSHGHTDKIQGKQRKPRQIFFIGKYRRIPKLMMTEVNENQGFTAYGFMLMLKQRMRFKMF